MHVLRSRIWLAVVGLTFAIFAIQLARAIFAAQPEHAARPESDRSAQAVPAIYVGRQQINTPAFIEQRQLFVPLRGVFEAIDAKVDFSPPRFVIVRKDGAVIAAFMLHRKRAIVGHQVVDLDAAPTQRNGRVYVPLRIVAQAAGASVAYTSRPPGVHIRQRGAATSGPALGDWDPQPPSTAGWRMGVAVFTGACCVGCLVLTARRFGPVLFGPGAKRAAPSPRRWPERAAAPPPREPVPEASARSSTAATPPREPEYAAASSPSEPDDPVAPPAPPDRVAVTSVETVGEARFRKEIVTETRTIEVPVTREELVIEYAGEGGVVLIQGRELASGETIRIPLWEERVQVDVIRHRLLDEDIVVRKRRSPNSGALPDNDAPVDFGIAEGSPS